MILEIALGIVLAVVILCALPAILVLAFWVLVIVGPLALVLVFIFEPESRWVTGSLLAGIALIAGIWEYNEEREAERTRKKLAAEESAKQEREEFEKQQREALKMQECEKSAKQEREAQEELEKKRHEALKKRLRERKEEREKEQEEWEKRYQQYE